MIDSNTVNNELSLEENLFLSIISDYLKNKPSCLPTHVSWTDLLDIAWKQEATAVLYYQLKRCLNDSEITESQKVKLFKTYANVSLKYDKRVKLLREIDEEFNRNKIRYFIFKGIDIAMLYPNPKLRTMGDSDILIHKNDEKKAHKCLLKLGCEVDGVGENEWQYHREDIHLELHRKMMNYEAANTKKQIAFFNKRWKYAVAEENSVHCHLDWNYHFIYVLTHLRKHFINSGVGFRQFMDITVIAKKCSLDWLWIQNELIKMDMWDFAKICFAFCERWFDVSFPAETAQITDDFYIESTKRIFKGGTYGTWDERNLHNYDIYKMETDNQYSMFESLKQRILLVFPPYMTLKYCNRYSFVSGKPYLVPVAWVYRIFKKLLKKIKKHDNMQEDNDVPKVTDEMINDRNNTLRRWKI